MKPPVVVALIAVALAAGRAQAGEAAEVVYQNGRIYTVSQAQPWAEAVAVRGGRFLKVGTTAEMKPLVNANTRVVDLGGRFVLPGLIDSHTHPSFEAGEPWHYETSFPWTIVKRHTRLAAVFRPSDAMRVKALATSLTVMSSFGITAIGEGKTDPALLPVWASFIREHGLHQHVTMFVLALDFDGAENVRGARQIIEAFRGNALPGVRLGAKIYIDGNLEYRTASLVDPYLDRGGVGRTNAPEVIRALVDELDAAGLPIQAHAIGDGGVRLALDALEPVMRRRGGRRGPVHTLVHLKLVHPDDLPRFAKLGVAATLYPWQAQPAPVTDFLMTSLGKPRVDESYLPLKKLWDAGAVVGSNSDWASGTMSPFYGMYVGVTRECPHQHERGKLGGRNGVTLEQMIRSYTINNAVILGMAEDAGSIAEGKSADMVVLDRNILERPIQELLETHVVETIFQGKVVYDDSMKLPDAVETKERELLQLGNGH